MAYSFPFLPQSLALARVTPPSSIKSLGFVQCPLIATTANPVLVPRIGEWVDFRLILFFRRQGTYSLSVASRDAGALALCYGDRTLW